MKEKKLRKSQEWTDPKTNNTYIFSDNGHGDLYNGELDKFLIFKGGARFPVSTITHKDDSMTMNRETFQKNTQLNKGVYEEGYEENDDGSVFVKKEDVNEEIKQEDQAAKVEDKKTWQETQNEKIDENIKNNFSGITDEQIGEFNKFLNKIHGKAPNIEDKKSEQLTAAEEDALYGLDAKAEKYDTAEELAHAMVLERNDRISDYEAEMDDDTYKSEGWDEEVNYDEVLEKIKNNPNRFERYLKPTEDNDTIIKNGVEYTRIPGSVSDFTDERINEYAKEKIYNKLYDMNKVQAIDYIDELYGNDVIDTDLYNELSDFVGINRDYIDMNKDNEAKDFFYTHNGFADDDSDYYLDDEEEFMEISNRAKEIRENEHPQNLISEIKNYKQKDSDEAVTAKERFLGRMNNAYNRNSEEVMNEMKNVRILEESEDYLLYANKFEDGQVWMSLMSSYDPKSRFQEMPNLYYMTDYQGRIKKGSVQVNWSAYGNVSADKAKEFASKIQKAVDFAERLNQGKDYSDLWR